MQDVSVVISACHADLKRLKRCIDSAVKQTWENIQFILLCPENDKAAGALCAEYAARDRRILLMHTEGGLSRARNEAMKRATGKWLWFLTADEYLIPDACEVVLLRAGMDAANVVQFACRKGSGNNEKRSHLPYLDSEMIWQKNEMHRMQMAVMEEAGEDEWWCLSALCTKLYDKRWVFQAGISFDETSGSAADRLFVLSALAKTQDILHVNRCLVHHTDNKNACCFNECEDAEQRHYLSSLNALLRGMNADKTEFSKAYWCSVFYSAENIVTKKYMHKGNQAPRSARKKELKTLLSVSPYARIKKHVKLHDVPKIHKINYLFYCMGRYQSIRPLA